MGGGVPCGKRLVWGLQFLSFVGCFNLGRFEVSTGGWLMGWLNQCCLEVGPITPQKISEQRHSIGRYVIFDFGLMIIIHNWSSTTCGMRWEVGGMYHFQGMAFRLMPLFAAMYMHPSEDVCWTWLDHPTVSGFRDMIPPFEGLLGHGSHLRVKFKAVDEVWQPGGILEALRLQGEWWVCCRPPSVCTLDSFGEKIQCVLVPTYNGIHMPSHFFAGWQLFVDLRMKAHLSKT